MKKLLFTFLLAAAGLQGWAGDKYPDALFAVGSATSFDWGPDNNPATAPVLYKKSNKVYEGFVNFDTQNGMLKFLVTNAYNQGQWGPSTNETSITTSPVNELQYTSEGWGDSDKKFLFNLDLGLYLVTVDLTTENQETITFKKWTSADDVYEIGNLNQLKAFADCVNKFDATINGKLTADIGSSDGAKMDYAIGWHNSNSDHKWYSGEFDGDSHTVYLGIDDTNNSNKGLFGAATGGANIHDIIVDGSVKAKAKVAGIIGYADGGGEITLNKVINKATIQSTGNQDANAAGLVGCAVNNTIFDASSCGNAGDVSGQDGQCAAFAGWTADNGKSGNDYKKTKITSCWNTGTINNMDNNCNLYRNTGKVEASSCYDASATGTRTQGTLLTVNGANNVTIANVTDLTNFSSIVNLGASFLNAELTADIATYSGAKIGDTKDHYYTGTFDGKGKKITINYNNSSENEIALFKYVDGCTIKNLIVDGSITGNKFLAGLVNYAYHATTIQNVVVAVNINSSLDGDGTHGGVISVAQGEGTPIIENVAFVGSINASKSSGTCGLIGYAHNGGRIIYRNCYVSGTLDIADGKVFGRNGEFCENCYTTNTTLGKLNDSPRFLSGGEVETGDVSSGKLCYMLNGDQKNIIWYQNLSGTTDSYPVPFSTHSRVYASPATGSLKCDGTSANGSALSYSNTVSVIPDHNYSDGFCSVCDAYKENAFTANNEGWFEVANANQLRWMAYSVNKPSSPYKKANIKLTRDIDYTDNKCKGQSAMFGLENIDYQGTFDGQYHTVTVDFTNNDKQETALFRRISDTGIIKNLKVDGNIHTNQKLAAGICAGIFRKGIITNCWSDVTITDTSNDDATHGGILARTSDTGSHDGAEISNCIFSGKILAGSREGCAGIVGWTEDQTKNKIQNCLVTGTLNFANVNTNGVIARSNATLENNYYTCTISGNNIKTNGLTQTTEGIDTGELCYLLNGSTCYDVNWTQTIGTDAYPIPFNTQGIVNKISAAGYTTQYIPTTDVTIPEGVEAYAGVVSGNWLRLVPVEDEISKEDAVILRGDEGYYSFVPTTGVSKATNNLLGSDGTINGGDGIYALSKKGTPAVVGFYPVGDEVTIPAGKAYLNTSAGVKGFTFVFDDDETGINSLTPALSEGEGVIYNLAGQRVSKLQKGINIINGKKVLF